MSKVEKLKIRPDICACLDDEGENLIITVELPGINKEKIDIEMYEDLFSIRAEREYSCQASAKAARKLLDMGYEKTLDFKAGKKGWRQAGLELEKTGK